MTLLELNLPALFHFNKFEELFRPLNFIVSRQYLTCLLGKIKIFLNRIE